MGVSSDGMLDRHPALLHGAARCTSLSPVLPSRQPRTHRDAASNAPYPLLTEAGIAPRRRRAARRRGDGGSDRIQLHRDAVLGSCAPLDARESGGRRAVPRTGKHQPARRFGEEHLCNGGEGRSGRTDADDDRCSGWEDGDWSHQCPHSREPGSWCTHFVASPCLSLSFSSPLLSAPFPPHASHHAGAQRDGWHDSDAIHPSPPAA